MIENSLDEKNTELYNSLNIAGVQFDSIIDTNFNSWAVQPVYKFKIVANNAEPSPSSLAHELLHIYIVMLTVLWIHSQLLIYLNQIIQDLKLNVYLIFRIYWLT